MKSRVFLCGGFLLFVTACKQAAIPPTQPVESVAPVASADPIPEGAPGTVVGFTIQATLSPAAMQKLSSAHETVVFSTDYMGIPKAGTPKKFIQNHGTVNLGRVEVAVSPGQPAHFGPLQVKPDLLPVTEGNPRLLINVSSGRKSSPDNLLDCNIYEDLAKNLPANYSIPCKLIGE